jgi:hypothetical protein
MESARISPAPGLSHVDGCALAILFRITLVGRIVVAGHISRVLVMFTRKAAFIVSELRSRLQLPLSQFLNSHYQMHHRHRAFAAWLFCGFSSKPSQLAA